MSKDQITRDTAYALWEADGRPEGNAEAYWVRAEMQVEAQLASSQTQSKDAANSGSEAGVHVIESAAPKKARSRKRPATATAADVIVGSN